MARWQKLTEQIPPHLTLTERGLRVRFAVQQGTAADVVVGELSELANLERECCAFATWSARAAGDSAVLDIDAIGDDGIEIVQAMFADMPHSVGE